MSGFKRLTGNNFTDDGDDDDSDGGGGGGGIGGGEDSDDGRDYSWKKTIMIGPSYQASVPGGLSSYGDTLSYGNITVIIPQRKPILNETRIYQYDNHCFSVLIFNVKNFVLFNYCGPNFYHFYNCYRK